MQLQQEVVHDAQWHLHLGEPLGGPEGKLFQVRRTSGQVHTDAYGEETHVSTDGSALCFLVGAPTMLRNQMALKTEHERVFLTREEDEPMFARELAPQERSPLLYVNVQDGYLETKLGPKLDQVISVIKQESCRMRERLTRSDVTTISRM